MRLGYLCFTSLLISVPIKCWAECRLDDLIGYTIIAKKTIIGRVDKDGRHDDFQGCDYGRIIIFDDNTGVACQEYGYEYAYRPDAYIMARGGSIKMCVEGDMYHVGSLSTARR
jgi:hypothetical protein